MRSLVVPKYQPILLSILLAPLVLAQTVATPPAPGAELAGAQKLFRQGDFKGTASVLQKKIAEQPSPDLYALLVQSLLKLDDVKSADENSRRALEAFPQSALAHATRGDAYFRRGLIPEAESEYKSGLKTDENCARAWLGKGKVDAVLAKRDAAKQEVSKAHELDPEDGDALYEWAVRQQYPENVAGLEKHLSGFRSDPQEEGHERDYMDLIKALAGRRVWILNPEVDHAEIKLDSLSIGPSLGTRGYGLRVNLNDRANAMLLLDTGASGVTITRKLAEKIGARKLSDAALEGVGKTGATHGYRAWVDKVTIGGLEFHDCFVHVAPDSPGDLDGMIGIDIFANFLITVDFRAHKLRLGPLPTGTDESDSFSQAFTFGHLLLLWTQASQKVAGLFVVDSGSNVSTIAPGPAQQLRQIRPLNTTVMGMSGGVNSAFIADDVILQFGKARRQDQRIITVDLKSVSKNLGTEVTGQIGFNTLESMRVVINYRDGLVGLDSSK